MSASNLESYLLAALECDEPTIEHIIMGEIYIILVDQGSSRKEFLDACNDSEQAKAAFTKRLIARSGFSESIVKKALFAIVSTPAIANLFRDCVKELSNTKRR